MSEKGPGSLDLSGVLLPIAIEDARSRGDSTALISYLRRYDHVTRELADLLADILERKVRVRRRKVPTIAILRREVVPLYEWYLSVLLGTLDGEPQFLDEVYSVYEDRLRELAFEGDLADETTARNAAKRLVSARMGISLNKVGRCIHWRAREGARVRKKVKSLTQRSGTGPEGAH